MLRRQKELQKLLHQVHEESSEYYNQFVTWKNTENDYPDVNKAQ
jgi:hypothetical protein